MAAGVGETNYGIKNLFRALLGNNLSVFTCGDVATDCAVTEVNVLEAKAGDGCFVGGDFFQGSLVESQLVIVDGGEEDGKDVRPRELVSNYIVFSTDVMHVCQKLADEGQVVFLTRRMLSNTGEDEVRGL